MKFFISIFIICINLFALTFEEATQNFKDKNYIEAYEIGRAHV